MDTNLCNFLIYLFVYACVLCKWVYECHGVHVKACVQHDENRFSPPIMESTWIRNLGHSAWQQAPLYTEPYHLPNL